MSSSSSKKQRKREAAAAAKEAEQAEAEEMLKQLEAQNGATEEDEEIDSGSEEEEVLAEALAAGIVPASVKPEAINDTAGLEDALKSIRADSLPWVERLDLTSSKPIQVEKVDDDLARELLFYGQAMEAVKEARSRCEAAGIPHFRPADYWAEMMKDDSHMKKVKSKLLFEQQKIAAVEKRKREQEARKFAREVQAERLKEKAAAKKAGESAMKKWQKNRDKTAGPVDDAALEQIFKDAQKKGGRHGGASGKNSRRLAKDKKFGLGGPKRNSKSNTRESTADMTSFKPSQNRALPKGFSAKRPGSGPGQRPGKRRREMSRTRR